MDIFIKLLAKSFNADNADNADNVHRMTMAGLEPATFRLEVERAIQLRHTAFYIIIGF